LQTVRAHEKKIKQAKKLELKPYLDWLEKEKPLSGPEEVSGRPSSATKKGSASPTKPPRDARGKLRNQLASHAKGRGL